MARTFLHLSGKFYRVTLSLAGQRQPVRLISTTDNGQKAAVGGGRWRRFWRSWVPIPTSVGVTVLAVLQWRRLQRNRNTEPGTPTSIAKDWEITCYRAIPCRALSRAWGWVSSRHVPSPLRAWVYGLYSGMYGVNLDEMAGDLTDYPSLAQFFTRELKQGVRPIDASNCIVSPADGKILNCGQICSCHVEQIKGVTYKIQTFLGEPTWQPANVDSETNAENCNVSFIQEVIKSTKLIDENENQLVKESWAKEPMPAPFSGGVPEIVRYLFSEEQKQLTSAAEDWSEYKQRLLTKPTNELYQTVVYLAPGDYHRFHSPVQWTVNFRRHFQGELLSVNPLVAGWVPELFSLNERVVYVGQWQHGFFSMTAVGATNVGSIRVYSDKTLQTNTRKWKNGTRHKDRPMNVTWSKGEEVGEFRMGSTIVLIFEAPKDYKFNICQSQKVQVGQSLCCL